MRHRLFHRIFLSLLAFILLALVLAALAGHLLLGDVVRTHLGGHLEAIAGRIEARLPAPGRPPQEQQAALEELCTTWPVHAALWSAEGHRVAHTLAFLPPPPTGLTTPSWVGAGAATALAVPLHDGRALVLQPRRLPRPAGFIATLLALAALLAVASYPVARLVTRRLEGLETGVRRLGEGDLASRVEVRGRDELASLAASFNQAAERLQRLVEAQRRVLASASHELRSPLARLRMALELARDDPGGAQEPLDAAVAEVEELDALVEELLLAGRLELGPPALPGEPVDLAALLREEAARIGADVRAAPGAVRADPRLLRVLLRNLLENARRHGHGGAVEATAEPLPDAGGVCIRVSDRGPGVPEGERERIFEPFHHAPGHTESEDGGVGLGLYLVRRIAQLYGGTVTCAPRDGGGTVFEVRLPVPP